MYFDFINLILSIRKIFSKIDSKKLIPKKLIPYLQYNKYNIVSPERMAERIADEIYYFNENIPFTVSKKCIKCIN